MDKPISVGDLVVVVRWPCCGKYLGAIRRVVALTICEANGCECCNDKSLGGAGWPLADVSDAYFPIKWIKRIPPLDELGGLESEEVDKLPSQRMIEAAKRYKRLVTSK